MTAELARAWSNQSCKVTVVTMAGTETDFFELDRRVSRLQLSITSNRERSLVGMLAANIRRALTIRQVLVRERPDIALGMMTSAATLLALAAIGLPMKTFGSERTYPPMSPMGAAKEWLRWFTYGLLTGVVGQTEAAGHWLRKNTRACRVHVIPNHIELPLRTQDPVIAPVDVLGETRRCILAVGRMTEEKQFPQLIEAFSKLADQYPEWDLVMAGDGPDQPALSALVAARGLVGRVHIPGPAGNIGDWYERADIFAMTSRFEGFPNALLEAMAHGVPPVAFDCLTGPSEMIHDGENGFLIPLNDMDGFTEALAKLMKSDALRAEIGERALSLRDRFSTDYAVSAWFRVFDLEKLSIHK